MMGMGGLRVLIPSILGAILILIGGCLQAFYILRSLGITGVYSTLTLSGSDKVAIALYLIFPWLSFLLMLSASLLNMRGNRICGLLSVIATVLGIISIPLPIILGYHSSMAALPIMMIAVVMMIIASISLRMPKLEGGILTPLEISLTAVFSALTAVLTGTTGLMFPSPTGGYTHVGDAAIFIAALLFGAKVGGLVGIIGPVAADLFVGYPRWFVTVVAHGAEGFIAGLGRGKGAVIQVILLALAGFVMATTYFFVNIFIKGYPLAIISYIRDLFGQALVSIILGFAITKAVERAMPSLIVER